MALCGEEHNRASPSQNPFEQHRSDERRLPLDEVAFDPGILAVGLRLQACRIGHASWSSARYNRKSSMSAEHFA